MLRKKLALSLGALALFAVLAEGAASWFYFFGRLVRDRQIAEERYAEYDPELGWVSEPERFIPDMYGPGVFLRTNAQRFRATAPVPARAAAGRERLICSGDSYTFGYGVDNDHTWCHLLSVLEPRLETVNLGQGGYGVDQAYLWYRRDGVKLEHRIQILAFVTDDFRRMQSSEFIGFGKPLLRLEGGQLRVTNVPVPRPRPLARWLAGHAGHLRNLALMRLADAAAEELGGRPSAAPGASAAPVEIFRALLCELLALHKSRGSRLVLLYLPMPNDARDGAADGWRADVERLAAELEIPRLDLVPELRRLPPEEIDPFFIKGVGQQYFGAAGHYTAAGNEWVARRLLTFLRERVLPAP